MELAILLSLAASVCTATSSICQRLGARHTYPLAGMAGCRRSADDRGHQRLFQERLATSPASLAAEVAGLIVLPSARGR